MTKRIHNPRTGKYYAIRERTTKQGHKGQIVGLSSVAKKVQKNYRSAVKKLSRT